MIQQKIPIIVRMPLHLLSLGAIAFGPIFILMHFIRAWFILGAVLLIWCEFFRRFILWRLDCFWNLRTLQNPKDLPLNPDNEKSFKTCKGYMYWFFLGRDIEKPSDKK